MTKANDLKEKVAIEFLLYFGVDMKYHKELAVNMVKLLSSELDRQRDSLKKKIDLLIIQRMQKYANTPLKDRTNAFDVLYEINLEILKLLK